MRLLNGLRNIQRRGGFCLKDIRRCLRLHFCISVSKKRRVVICGQICATTFHSQFRLFWIVSVIATSKEAVCKDMMFAGFMNRPYHRKHCCLFFNVTMNYGWEMMYDA